MEAILSDKASKNPLSCGTHDGTFHADEVTACALLCLFGLIEVNQIIRTRDPHLLECCEYVCDVGGTYDPDQKLFDHHQADYEGPLSSAGMILKYLLSRHLITIGEYDHFNQMIIMGVDAHDNGRDPLIPGYCSFSHVISNFSPIHYDCTSEEQNQAFHTALQFAIHHLERLKKRLEYTKSCKNIVVQCMQKMDATQKCLIFEKNMPWLETFFELGGEGHEALFVIMPSGNHWKLRGIPPSYEERMKVRHPLPQEWAGLLEEDLKRISKINGAIFCHKGRFISVWETKEDALQALKYTLNS